MLLPSTRLLEGMLSNFPWHDPLLHGMAINFLIQESRKLYAFSLTAISLGTLSRGTGASVGMGPLLYL